MGSLLTPAQASYATDGSSSFLLYLFALNFNTSRQEHDLHPYDYPIPKEEVRKLTFPVPAGGWVLNKVRIPVAKEKGAGVHVLTFRTASTADKVGKGVLVGALTLGSVVYKQGHRGFSISLRVVPPTRLGSTTPMTTNAQGKICLRCNSLNSSAARFCSKCGNNLG